MVFLNFLLLVDFIIDQLVDWSIKFLFQWPCATLGWWWSGRCGVVVRNQVIVELNTLIFDFGWKLVDWSVEFLFHGPCATFRLVMSGWCGVVARNQVIVEWNTLIFDFSWSAGWLIDRIFVSSTVCYFRLVMEREMRSCGEEQSDCRIEYFNLWFWLISWLIDWSSFCFINLVLL